MLGEKRPNERRLAVAAIAAAGAVFAGCVAVIIVGSIFRADLRTALPGSIAPEIVSRDVDNQDIALSGLRGSCVLVYFQPDPAATTITTQSAEDSTSPSPSPVSTADRISADSVELKQLSVTLNARQVTIVESNRVPSEQPMQLMSVTARGFANLSDDSSRANRMLIDADGEIARNYRVDLVATEPTLFVIDAGGVIRYRGAVDQVAGSDLIHQLSPINGGKQLSVSSRIPASPSPSPAVTPIEPLASLIRF